MLLTDKTGYSPGANKVLLPFSLVVLQNLKVKKKCCKKYKKGKPKCKRCPKRKAKD